MPDREAQLLQTIALLEENAKELARQKEEMRQLRVETDRVKKQVEDLQRLVRKK